MESTRLRCAECGVEAVHRISYAGRIIASVECTTCGHVFAPRLGIRLVGRRGPLVKRQVEAAGAATTRASGGGAAAPPLSVSRQEMAPHVGETVTQTGTTLENDALRWIEDDVDPSARRELRQLVDAAQRGDERAAAELDDRMAGPLTFGTGGLRGIRRAGPNGVNRAVLIRTTAGLANWLIEHGQRGRTVLVGRDARHRSERFCADVAGVLAAAGFDVRVLPRPLPTPVLAFSVRALGAAAGVQITASHNHADDHGYKVYLEAGAQIQPSAAAEIEAAIQAAGPARAVPSATTWRSLDDELVDRYLDRVAAVPRNDVRDLRIAATPLHGVGGDTLVAALRRGGFTDVHLVPDQAEPDPDFPTVDFPNPEEAGATDAVLTLAEKIDADLVVALDPDADRCALGARDHTGRWRMLDGNETGVLLGEYVLATTDRPNPVVASTVVSSTLLRAVAAEYGAHHEETPVGFRWLVRAAEKTGGSLVFAYEEALGLCVDPDAVRDKDGVSAAVLAADLAARLKATGRTLFDALDDLAVRHGVHLTDQVSIRHRDRRALVDTMDRLRSASATRLGGERLTPVDFRPENNLLALNGDGVRVMFRPSGTEPKVKAYLEVVRPLTGPGTLEEARAAAAHRLAALRDEVAALLSG
jgi:phosphomannomutase